MVAIPFVERALAEIDGLHRALQAWFRAEGEQDPQLVLSHFDEMFTMVTPAGKVLPFETFCAAVPGMWGSRPGLLMEISEKTLLHSAAGTAVLTYKERQHLNGSSTDRHSTVLMLDRGQQATPAWRHLQETMIA